MIFSLAELCVLVRGYRMTSGLTAELSGSGGAGREKPEKQIRLRARDSFPRSGASRCPLQRLVGRTLAYH